MNLAESEIAIPEAETNPKETSAVPVHTVEEGRGPLVVYLTAGIINKAWTSSHWSGTSRRRWILGSSNP